MLDGILQEIDEIRKKKIVQPSNRNKKNERKLAQKLENMLEEN